MIKFSDIEITDKRWIVPLNEKTGIWGTHQNFINLFAWAKIFHYQVANLDNHLMVRGILPSKDPYYFYPVGNSAAQPVIEAIRQDANERGDQLLLFGLSKENVEEISDLYPGKFEFSLTRDSFDYVYLLEKLVTLSGKILHAKRNHINRFKANYQWNFEPIADENFVECWDMNIKWCKTHGCDDEKDLARESCAVRRCFNNYDELGLEGGLIRADGRVVAFTMGSKLNSDTYNIHIEKAFEEFQGAYQIINREFARFIRERYPQINYMNREEDMGDSGLRKAKLSYRPIRMEEKFRASLINGRK